MGHAGKFNVRPLFEKRVLYSPSTRRVITRVSTDLMGTIQLKDDFKTDHTIYVAPLDMTEMSVSWSNQEIDDWEERDVERWTDLAIPRLGQSR